MLFFLCLKYLSSFKLFQKNVKSDFLRFLIFSYNF